MPGYTRTQEFYHGKIAVGDMMKPCSNGTKGEIDYKYTHNEDKAEKIQKEKTLKKVQKKK